ncbi:MAG: cyclic nucleotide-binding domain-containing protein, partial [Pseudomonadales bacterium]
MALAKDEIDAIKKSGVISDKTQDINKLVNANNGAFASRFGPGEEVCQIDEDADRMWVIVEGNLEIYGQEKDQLVRLPVTRGPGEIVGEQGILEAGGTRTATVRSSTFTRVVVIPRDAIFSLQDQKLREQIFLNFARIISRKLGQATKNRSQAIGANQQVKEVLNRFTTEYSRRNVENYLRGDDPFKKVEAVFWFSDLVGFSVLADLLSPSDSAGLIRAVMELQAVVIAKHGGFVDKFMGDGLMAFWPKSDSWRDTSERALKAALVFKNGLPAGNLPNEASQVDLRIG